MTDMMTKIYDALIADEYIREKAEGRIKFYEYPETATLQNPYVVIDPLSPPLDSDFGDNDPIAEEYMYQIDVFTKNRLETKELSGRISKIMRSLGFCYYAGGVDEYDDDYHIFRDARRYRGKRGTH